MQVVQEMQERASGRLLSADEVGRHLGIDVSTVYRMAGDGRLTAVKVGRQWRFSPEALEHVHVRTEIDPLAAAAAIRVAADLLGVMMLVTDMEGCPVTPVVRPCPAFAQASGSLALECLEEWREAARDGDLGPRFRTSLLGFECASAFIRSGDRLVGMVIAGGVAPEDTQSDVMYSLTASERQRLLSVLPRVASAIVEGRTP